MPAKKLILTINAHQPYIRHFFNADKHNVENELFFNAVSKTYLPLVNMLHRLEDDKIPFKISIVLSPVLCSMLDDAFLKEQYCAWLDKRIALGEKEVKRCSKDKKILENAKKCLDDAKNDKSDFVEKYEKNLLKEFKHFSDNGSVELLGTMGTAMYVPHYADMKEILSAQVETGIYSHKNYFGSVPEGFYIPHLGYANSIDRILRSFGVNYTIVDPATILFAENATDDGVFAPVRTHYSLALFAKDKFSDEKINYSENIVYKNVEKDVGYELTATQLKDYLGEDSLRIATLYRYWAKDLSVYDSQKAREQVVEDAKDFVIKNADKLEHAAVCLNKDVCSVFEIEASDIGENWEEGIYWLENVIRLQEGFELATCAPMMEKQFTLDRIKPYPCSENGSGYGEDLLDKTNSYMIRYLRKMCERIVDLAQRFPDETGLKERLLNLGAKELMIAQDSVWAQMIHDGKLTEYSKKVFKDCVLNFTEVFEALGTNTVSTEWLTKLEKEHTIFPWMNYRIFTPKV